METKENLVSFSYRLPRKTGHYDIIRKSGVRERAWFHTMGCYDGDHKWVHPVHFRNDDYAIIEDVEFWIEKQLNK